MKPEQRPSGEPRHLRAFEQRTAETVKNAARIVIYTDLREGPSKVSYRKCCAWVGPQVFGVCAVTRLELSADILSY